VNRSSGLRGSSSGQPGRLGTIGVAVGAPAADLIESAGACVGIECRDA
jgi:hypothetical protein